MWPLFLSFWDVVIEANVVANFVDKKTIVDLAYLVDCVCAPIVYVLALL